MESIYSFNQNLLFSKTTGEKWSLSSVIRLLEINTVKKQNRQQSLKTFAHDIYDHIIVSIH